MSRFPAISIFVHVPAKLRVGIVGCGAVTERYHLPALLASPDVEVVGFADVALPRARALAEHRPGAVAVAGSRADLERTLGRPVRTFAYPFGRVGEAIKDAVKVAGFDAAWGSRSGVSDPAAPDFALPRIEVRGTDSLLSFAVAIWRGRSPSRSARRT